MLNRRGDNIIRRRELLPIALTEKAKQFKLLYKDTNFSFEIQNEALVSIESELILAINLGGYIPKTKKPEVTILDEIGNAKGKLKISLFDTLLIEGENIHLCKIDAARSFILPMYSRIADNFIYALKKGIRYKANDLSRLRRLFVYYTKPRPAFLLSIKDEEKIDIFPVDLTGIIAENYMPVAIKSTNKAIDIIRKTKSVCLSAVPFASADLIYKHSEQRKNGNMSLRTLLFTTSESQILKIPVPDFAVYVNELHVEQSFEKGSYTVFIMKLLNKYTLSGALQLAHTPWYNKPLFG